MPTFLLKKYDKTQSEEVNQETVEAPKTEKKEDPEELTITVSGTISQIVAMALQKALVQSDVEVTEVPTDDNQAEVKAISTENINDEPVDTLRSIQENDFVFIHTNGFTTAQEAWFLTNIENKTKNVVYTIESFINHVKKHFKLD